MMEESANQRQARLRRERREAKLKAEGTSRLEKITKVSGRQNLPDAPPIHPTSQLSSPSSGDPPEEDISQSSTPFPASQPPNGATEADVRALLRASIPGQGDQNDANQSMEEDPMMTMLSQLMGGMPGGPNGAEGMPEGLPPGLAAMMGGGGPATAQPEVKSYDYLWKVVHAVFAFALAVYVVATSTALSRPVVRIPGKVEAQLQARDGVNLFWAFATVELGLQSARYFLERGKTGSGIGGWMATVSAVLPEPWGGYLRLGARYSGIWSTGVEDACVLIFVVGVVSWWKGALG